MFLIKTVLQPSYGIGVFADEEVATGRIVWRFDPRVDRTFESLDDFEEPVAGFLGKYTYLDPTRRLYVLCGDDARFVNHSDTPNLRPIWDRATGLYVHDEALRPIRRGEELTIDYRLIHEGCATLTWMPAPGARQTGSRESRAR